MTMSYEEFDEDQPCCVKPDIITTDDGLRVCRNCGLTFGHAYEESEQRAYSAEEIRARRRTEPI
jgi:hypothetical protein